MNKFMIIVGVVAGSSLGWWAGKHIGIMTAYLLGVIGAGAGMYAAKKIIRNYGW